MRRSVLLLALACGKPTAPPPQPPQSPQPQPAPEAATPTAEPAQKPDAPIHVVELDTSKPTHRALAWLLDVLGKRNGVVDRAELEQYAAKSMLGPLGIERGLRNWAADSAGAVAVKLVVDDPTYLRALVFAGGKRWRFILEVDASSKLVFAQRDAVE